MGFSRGGGYFTWEELSMKELVVRVENLPWKGSQISDHYLEND